MAPAIAVAVLIGGAARWIISGLVVPGEPNMRNQLIEDPLIVLPRLLWPLWAVALALAALDYRERRLLTQRRCV